MTMKEKWAQLSLREQLTIRALLGTMSAPFIFTACEDLFYVHYISEGGAKAIMATIGLWSIYYLTARSIIDLVTDSIDWVLGRYTLLGGDIKKIVLRRTKEPPYDVLQYPDVKRDWSTWQHTLAFLRWIEFFAMCFATIGVLATTKYDMNHSAGIFFCKGSSDLVSVSCGLGEAAYSLSYYLMYFSMSSMVGRNEAGVVPVLLRWCGLPNYHPGQNIFPPWLNQLMIRLFGRPM